MTEHDTTSVQIGIRGQEPALTMQRVRRVYSGPSGDVVALAGLTLDVKFGEVVALMGRSGTGKTTALNILCGLDEPTGGSASVLGVDVTQSDRRRLTDLRRHRIGRVFQDSDLLDELDAVDNVALAVELRTGARRGQAREVAREALQALGVGDRLGAYPRQMSGGEKQRVGIARAIASKVDLILADEPTGSLDEFNAIGVAEALRLAADCGAAVLVATHDHVVADRVDRIVRTDAVA